MIKTALFAAAAVLATAATAAPVLAKDVTVHYGDLNLASIEGQHTLGQRINRAARTACDVAKEPGIRSREAVACYEQARAKATIRMAALIKDGQLGG